MAHTRTRSIPVRTYERAIRLSHGWITLRHGPAGKVPNATTRRALRDAKARRNLLGPYDDTDQMFRELGV